MVKDSQLEWKWEVVYKVLTRVGLGVWILSGCVFSLSRQWPAWYLSFRSDLKEVRKIYSVTCFIPRLLLVWMFVCVENTLINIFLYCWCVPVSMPELFMKCFLFVFKVPFLCPLEGHIHLKMQCEVGSKVEERGFLVSSGFNHPYLELFWSHSS